MRNCCVGLGVLCLSAFGCGGVVTTPVSDPPVQFPSGGPPRLTPAFGATTTAAIPPPPISGGTLLATADGKFLVAADPDRDRLYVVSNDTHQLTATIVLDPLDEPGRLAEDGAGRVHVALRGGGALVTIDPATGAQLFRRPVCAAPRGVAWDSVLDQIHVACAGGELVTLLPTGGDVVRTVQLDSGLRDVVVDRGDVQVSRFREAELLAVSSDGLITARRDSENPTCDNCERMPAGQALAWRTRALDGGGVGMLFETAQLVVGTQPGAYGDNSGMGCGAIVGTAYSRFGQAGGTAQLALAVLPVDFAISQSGANLAVVATGNASLPGVAQVMIYATEDLQAGGFSGCIPPALRWSPTGQATAIVATGSEWVVQTREPATLQFSSGASTITLSTDSRADTGHTIFHSDSGGGLACASCHGEGAEDARTWQFDAVNARRTQSLRGRLLGSGPFHWDGSEADLPHLINDVFVGRMSGPVLDGGQIGALSSWIGALPPVAVSAPVDVDAVARGSVVFHDPTVACASCHAGAAATNRAIVDVGTGGLFKVPSLRGVWARAPYMHTGCAGTLDERFSADCGGSQHGNTANLAAGQISDLIAYLNSL